VVMSWDQHTQQSHGIKIDKSFENVEQLKYWGTTLTDLNSLHDGTKTRLIRNAYCIRCGIFCLPVCYPKNQVLLKYYLPVVLYGSEAWFLTLREEQRLRMFKNRVLRKIFEP
jgi:hypothetical protein